MSANNTIKEKCPNGHYYNKTKYASCPYCEKMKRPTPEAEAPQDMPEQSAPTEASDTNDIKTAVYANVGTTDPVVGWLVCIKGKHFGECFELFAGRNEIGRGAGKDISLFDEPSISQKTHAVIIFDPRSRRFFLHAGNSHGLTYLNGDIVVSHEPLASRSIVIMGDVAFIFIALCGEDFDWQDAERYCE